MELKIEIEERTYPLFFCEGVTMTREKIKKILDALDGITHQEFKKLSEYMLYKTEANKKFKNDELAYETIKTFFIEIED